MSAVARALLVRLLAQADRGGRPGLPIAPRTAPEYFAVSDLPGRDAIHACLANAQAQGCIALDWGRAAAAQDLVRIRLLDADRLSAWLGVPRSAELAAAIALGLDDLLADAPQWLREAYSQALGRWRLGGTAYRTAAGDTQGALRLFRTAVAVATGRHEGLDLRRFSVQLLGDSKAIESLQGRLAELLRRNPDWAQLDEDQELLRALGLEKYPPPLLIKGPIALRYGTAWLDLGPLRPYLALCPAGVSAVRAGARPPYLLTVENLSSFQRQVREIEDEGIVLYTGGFPAPSLVRVLGLLDLGLPADCPFYHWGDRDPGGLRIYAKVAAACPIHGVSPHSMAEPTGDPAGWLPDDRRALERIAGQGGTPGSLAERWLAQCVGRLEQEAVDPRPPECPARQD